MQHHNNSAFHYPPGYVPVVYNQQSYPTGPFPNHQNQPQQYVQYQHPPQPHYSNVQYQQSPPQFPQTGPPELHSTSIDALISEGIQNMEDSNLEEILKKLENDIKQCDSRLDELRSQPTASPQMYNPNQHLHNQQMHSQQMHNQQTQNQRLTEQSVPKSIDIPSPNQQPSKTYAKAIYDYRGSTVSEFSFKKGYIFEILESSEGWLRGNMLSITEGEDENFVKTGYLPETYVRQLTLDEHQNELSQVIYLFQKKKDEFIQRSVAFETEEQRERRKEEEEYTRLEAEVKRLEEEVTLNKNLKVHQEKIENEQKEVKKAVSELEQQIEDMKESVSRAKDTKNSALTGSYYHNGVSPSEVSELQSTIDNVEQLVSQWMTYVSNTNKSLQNETLSPLATISVKEENKESLSNVEVGSVLITKYDYKGTTDKELTFTKGEFIVLLEKDQTDFEGWCKGSIGGVGGKIGYFPSSFVEKFTEGSSNIDENNSLKKLEEVRQIGERIKEYKQKLEDEEMRALEEEEKRLEQEEKNLEIERVEEEQKENTKNELSIAKVGKGSVFSLPGKTSSQEYDIEQREGVEAIMKQLQSGVDGEAVTKWVKDKDYRIVRRLNELIEQCWQVGTNSEDNKEEDEVVDRKRYQNWMRLLYFMGECCSDAMMITGRRGGLSSWIEPNLKNLEEEEMQGMLKTDKEREKEATEMMYLTLSIMTEVCVGNFEELGSGRLNNKVPYQTIDILRKGGIVPMLLRVIETWEDVLIKDAALTGLLAVNSVFAEEDKHQETKNRVIKELVDYDGVGGTIGFFAQEFIRLVNKVSRSSKEEVRMMKLLVRMLNDIFDDEKGRQTFFYTTDLNVLVDVLLRQIPNVEGHEMVLQILDIIDVVVKKSLWQESGAHRRFELKALLKNLIMNSAEDEIKEKCERIMKEKMFEGEGGEKLEKIEDNDKIKKVEKKEFRKTQLESLAKNLVELDKMFGETEVKGAEQSDNVMRPGRASTANLTSLADTLKMLNANK